MASLFNLKEVNTSMFVNINNCSTDELFAAFQRYGTAYIRQLRRDARSYGFCTLVRI